MKAVMVMSLVMMLVAVVIDMWDMMVILMGKVRVVCVTCRHDCNKNNDDYRHMHTFSRRKHKCINFFAK